MPAITGALLWAGPSTAEDNVCTEFFDARAELNGEVSVIRKFSIGGDSPQREGVEHFSIADHSPQKQLTSRAQQFNEVARSLETAVSAIRHVINTQQASVESGITASKAVNATTRVATPMGVQRGCPTFSTPRSTCRQIAQAQKPGCEMSGLGGLGFKKQEGGNKVTVAKLSMENKALRGALGDAVKRLSELEGEQERFMSEGVFDLVNSLCREQAPTAAEAAAGPPLAADNRAT